MTDDKLPGKVFVRFKRMDNLGLQNTLTYMNELIEKGYRFSVSDLLIDKPQLRNSQPQFTMSLPDFVQPMEEPVFDPARLPSWYTDMTELEAALERLETLTKKDQLVAFQEELKLFAPEDKKQPAAIKVWLAEQIKSHRR
jgi:hypothetical protein